MSSNRSTPRVSRIENGFTCSRQSILSAMDRFVKAVNNMDSTVLVPSRLQDIDLSNNNNELSGCLLPAILGSPNWYNFFTMSKDVQNELLWGPTIEHSTPSRYGSCGSSPNNLRVMNYVRQLSDNSQKSDSDVESVDDPDSIDEQSSSSTANNIASAFRYHLLGLHSILHELADTADFLSSRYLDEIECSST